MILGGDVLTEGMKLKWSHYNAPKPNITNSLVRVCIQQDMGEKAASYKLGRKA